MLNAILTAAVPSLAGALLLYAASPNQQLSHRPLPARRSLAAAGVAGLLVTLVLLLRTSGPATAVFILTTFVMLVWSIAPLAIAWWRHREARGR